MLKEAVKEGKLCSEVEWNKEFELVHTEFLKFRIDYF